MLGLFIYIYPKDAEGKDAHVNIPTDITGWQKGFVVHDATETEKAGELLANLIPADTALLLQGKMGVGKTTFARGFARGLGITGDITSPSFSVLNLHQGRRQLLHVDAYRLTQPSQWDSLLIDEVCQSPWNLLVEWPENIRGREPQGAWILHLENVEGENRRVVLQKS